MKIFIFLKNAVSATPTPTCLQVDQMGEVTKEEEKDSEDSGEEETKVWKLFSVQGKEIEKYAIPASTKNLVIGS